MYAIITDGGRQYRVEVGQELDIDLRPAATGSQISFDQVLAVGGEGGLKLGTPHVAGASVTAQVLEEMVQGDKISIQKFRRRKNYRRRTGHRQKYTRIVIDKISV